MTIRIIMFFLLTSLHASDFAITVENFLGRLDARLKEGILTSLNFSGLEPINLEGAEQSLVTIHSQQFGGGEIIETFKVYDPAHFLMQGDIFAVESLEPHAQELIFGDMKLEKASGGTRKVGIYTFPGGKLCLKQGPEAPAAEIAAYQAYKRIFPNDSSIPASEVILMNGQVFQVSEFMEGTPLSKVFNDLDQSSEIDSGICIEQASSYKFNQANFQRLAIFSFITVPEDSRPQNYLVRKTSTDEHEFVLIDNERSFGRVVSEVYNHPTLGSIQTRVHCALFCFQEMLHKPLTVEVISELFVAGKGIGSVILRITREEIYHRSLMKLIRLPERTEGTILALPFNAESVRQLSQRFNSLALRIWTHYSDSLGNIFSAVAPDINTIYRFDEPSTEGPILLRALERIYAIDAGRINEGKAPESSYLPVSSYTGGTERDLSVILEVLRGISRNQSLSPGEGPEVLHLLPFVETCLREEKWSEDLENLMKSKIGEQNREINPCILTFLNSPLSAAK